jgi:exosome complex component RRP4
MSILLEKRQIVTPGDLIAEGNFIPGSNTFQEDNKIYANRLGLVDFDGKKIYVVALNSFYFPVVGDQVIGKITDVNISGWTVNINSSYVGILRASEALNRPFNPQRDDLSRILKIGDLIVAVIIGFDRTKDPHLTLKERGLGKIAYGKTIKVDPAKIPRIIGRKGSMVKIIKEGTKCKIIVGKNGLISISGEDPEAEKIAIKIIQKIVTEAHTSGLTNRITEMIKKEEVVV